ncbi:MutS-like protein [Coemansia erecta]|uniref:MutS-like protein n=1 Tax=Coemansia erecta TaxID=147472 RepID=A0A9W8CR30_9FUNG|nr:MutS-like protein [Coemansia erecta]
MFWLALTELAHVLSDVANHHAIVSIAPATEGTRGELNELANFPGSVVRLAKRKADELEDFGTTDADMQTDQQQKEEEEEEEGAKQPVFDKGEVARGSRTIEMFLAEFAATPGLPDMPPNDIAQRINDLRAKYDGEIAQNPWLARVGLHMA